ncbi:hypothetical protein B0H11DRAFT_1939668 [Mycena galericulata]|nr:hypothetical protein B0H11DRAFT_1939668 [Mycena galericulata]
MATVRYVALLAGSRSNMARKPTVFRSLQYPRAPRENGSEKRKKTESPRWERKAESAEYWINTNNEAGDGDRECDSGQGACIASVRETKGTIIPLALLKSLERQKEYEPVFVHEARYTQDLANLKPRIMVVTVPRPPGHPVLVEEVAKEVAKAKLTTRISKREIDAEAEPMEALADAEEEEQPDDGAVEGPSEDEYEP